MPVHHDPKPASERGLKIIHASLFRMGTKSMAMAYQSLGYRVHHALMEDITDSPWAALEHAAEATYPSLHTTTATTCWPRSQPPSPPPPRYTRRDWDAIWGDTYDVATDIACPFTFELIAAYPDAKVIVVQRDFDKWWPSFAAKLRDAAMGMPQAAVGSWALWYLMSCRAGYANRKMLKGMFGVASARELTEQRARAVYDEFFARVRREVPEERRLEFVPGRDGWDVLCGFLEVDVPRGEDGEVLEFPCVNTGASHGAEIARRRRQIWEALAKFGVGVVVVGGVIAALLLR